MAHINPNIDSANFEQLIQECIDSIAPVEREVKDRQGRWYSLRIRPYRSIDNKIDGAVLALFDIDVPKRFEESVRMAIALAEAILQSSVDPMAIVDAGLRVKSANDRFAQQFGTSADLLRGRTLVELVRPGRSIEQLLELARANGDTPARERALDVTLADESRRTIHISARAFPAYDGDAGRVLLVTAEGAGRQPRQKS